MSSAESVSAWIVQLQTGDHAAAQRLWERYFPRLVGLARNKLAGLPRAAADEEDVALSVFGSFCRAAEGGSLPQLHDRDNLWPLLVVITARKAHDLREREGRQKRGGGRVRGEADLAADGVALAEVISHEPTPAFAAQVAEEFHRLLNSLRDPGLCAIALWKMEGWTNEEIATRLGCVSRTVERRLQVIRSLWAGEDVP